MHQQTVVNRLFHVNVILFPKFLPQSISFILFCFDDCIELFNSIRIGVRDFDGVNRSVFVSASNVVQDFAHNYSQRIKRSIHGGRSEGLRTVILALECLGPVTHGDSARYYKHTIDVPHHVHRDMIVRCWTIVRFLESICQYTSGRGSVLVRTRFVMILSARSKKMRLSCCSRFSALLAMR